MTTEPPAVHARRVPLAAWNAACRLVAGDSAQPTDAEWDALATAGLSQGPGVLKDRWAGLIRSFLDTPSSVRCSATHRGLLHRASLALGPVNVCVLERFTTTPLPDGSVGTVPRDDELEVAVTRGHPWSLLRRVLPPLPTVQAPMRQTSAQNAEPVRLPDFDSADHASVAWAWTTTGPDGPLLSCAWYLASAEHLFRATFSDDPPFQEVRPGDLAFTFEYQLLGVLDALGAPKGA